MTTVVVANNRVVTDSLACIGHTKTNYDAVKAMVVGEYIIAGAGRMTSIYKFFDWFQDKLSHEEALQKYPYLNVIFPADLVEQDFTGVVLLADGGVLIYEGGSAALESTQPVTIGSGGEFALAALYAGAEPEEAVEIAIKMDCFSGGGIVTYEIEEPVVIPQLVKEDLNKLTKKQLIDMLTETDIE